MKRLSYTWMAGLKRGLIIALCAGAVTAVWADGFRFAVIGDHRGDNKAFNETGDGYTDEGITKPVVIDIARALRAEKVNFVLDVGDMATKWQQQLTNITADVLMESELADWAALWIENSGGLPIYPVRGNQEVSASREVWKAFTASLPGISTLPLNGPEGEEGFTYAFKYQNCLFVGVDQYISPLANNDSHPITAEAMEWLKWVMPESGQKFVFGHVPAFEVWDPKVSNKNPPFTAIKDGLASPYALFNPDSLALRNAFWDLMGKHKANYFCGHDHIYTRAKCLDTQGRWARQVIIGNGGAPLPAMFSTVYTAGWFAEAYAGRAFPTVAGFSYQLESPLAFTESMPTFDPPEVTTRTYGFGYVVVDVRGSKVTARYMAEPAAGGAFVPRDSWTLNH